MGFMLKPEDKVSWGDIRMGNQGMTIPIFNKGIQQSSKGIWSFLQFILEQNLK